MSATMRKFQLCLAILLTAAVVLPVAAQDFLTIGSVSAPAGTRVSVPVSVRDVSGTAIGTDAIAGRKIQAFSFRVLITPAAAATNVTFERAGVIQSLTPLYERSHTGIGSTAYLASFPEGTQTIPFVSGAAAPGNRIGTLSLTIGAALAAGTKITLAFDQNLTALSNQAGTLTETTFNRRLKIVPGTVTVGGSPTTTTLASSMNPATAGDSVTFTATVTSGTPGDIGGTMYFLVAGNVVATSAVTVGQASWTTSALAPGTHSVTARYEGSGVYQPSTSAPLSQVVSTPVIAAPTGVTATATGSTAIAVSWNAVGSAASYEILRSSNGLPYEVAGTSATTSFNDPGRTPGTTYLYVVRSVTAAAQKSARSALDGATTVVFTNQPLAAGVPVRLEHLEQLRTAVNAWRAAAGLTAFAFTDPSPTTATIVKRVHLEQLRAALAPARTALGLSAIGYTDPTLTETTRIKAVHVAQLRSAVQ
ncbi:MAG TPA: Ig-like domain repeat protein [Thermoanaerobaculia bacterium]|nr:Ig-like domain repeat protein [Thermoanaerobaculia bacterium]